MANNLIPSRPAGTYQPPTLANVRLPSRPPVVTGNAGKISANPANASWRARLRMASFKGQTFYVDQQGRSSGRRMVLFEYPKRDMPFAEDMGRAALRYQITGYLIQAPGPGGRGATYNGMDSDYDVARDRLEAALMQPGPGILRDPYNPRFYPPLPGDTTSLQGDQISSIPTLPGYTSSANLQFYCERYSIIESREKGGFCTVEMSFVEAGLPVGTSADMNSTAQVSTAAQTLQQLQAGLIALGQQRLQQIEAAPPVQVPATPVPPVPQPPADTSLGGPGTIGP